jgi:type I restriction enzyme M protein
MNNFGELVSFIWSVADLIRDAFRRSHYQDVILPLTVLRRVDCVLAPTKAKVLETHNKLKGKLDNLAPQLCKASGFAFYNTSKYDFSRLLQETPQLGANLRAYINGFSDNMRDVLEKFNFDNTITQLQNANLLFKVLERFAKIDLHPDRVSNHDMGHVFEELIRKFNEALNENPGEHFTPREVIRLMVNVLLAQDQGTLARQHAVRTVYDPCCGSGGMLTIAKEHMHAINPRAEVHLFGQEVNPQTFAVCKSDLYMQSADGRDAENIVFGSTLSADQHADSTFDYLLANPPYGKDWHLDEKEVRAEAGRGDRGRFGAGLPRISDGQLLFLQHMLGRMHDPGEGVSRVAIIMNGSPLFTGDAGSGESEIRRWILENDWLEALVALPEQLFYNTGIATYVWVLSNRKAPQRAGLVQLIDASDLWVPLRKNLGEKRREIGDGQVGRPDQIGSIRRVFEEFREGTFVESEDPPRKVRCKIFPTTAFGYRKVTVERPLRLNFQAAPERLARLEEARAFANLAVSRKKDGKEKAADEAAGGKQQEAIRRMLKTLPGDLFKDRAPFLEALDEATWGAGVKLSAPVRRAVLDALAERNETAEMCRDEDGRPEPDPELRDTENVPLGEDVDAFVKREVKPHVPDAWLEESVRDEKDGQVGKVGYEINFNRYFYEYRPPRPLEAIEADIKAVEQDILKLLKEVAG